MQKCTEKQQSSFRRLGPCAAHSVQARPSELVFGEGILGGGGGHGGDGAKEGVCLGRRETEKERQCAREKRCTLLCSPMMAKKCVFHAWHSRTSSSATRKCSQRPPLHPCHTLLSHIVKRLKKLFLFHKQNSFNRDANTNTNTTTKSTIASTNVLLSSPSTPLSQTE